MNCDKLDNKTEVMALQIQVEKTQETIEVLLNLEWTDRLSSAHLCKNP